jgi:hypothetical protein
MGGWVRKILPPPGLDPRTVQPVAIRYTDWAIAAWIVVSTSQFYKEVDAGQLKTEVILESKKKT